MRQRGVAAIAMAILTVAVAGAALGSFLLHRSQQAQWQVEQQRDTLAWAHQAVEAFIGAHGRLPCPASSRAGAENCSILDGKGWLPVGSLLAHVATSGSPAPASIAMRYLVDRGAGVVQRDLAASGALYQPVFLPGDRPGNYRADLAGSMDVCARLDGVEDATGLAYGIAVAAPGAPDSNSGVNADFTQAVLESPRRSADHAYRDRVSLRTHGEVYAAARCGEASASLNALAAATTWVDVATDTQQANVERGAFYVQVNSLGVMSDALYLVDAMADLLNGAYNLMHNASKMGVASSNPFLWPYVPVHAGGISKAATGVALSAVDTARNAGTLFIHASQLQKFRDMSRDAIDQPVWQGALDMLAVAHAVGVSAHLPDDLPTFDDVQP